MEKSKCTQIHPKIERLAQIWESVPNKKVKESKCNRKVLLSSIIESELGELNTKSFTDDWLQVPEKLSEEIYKSITTAYP